MSEPPKPTTEEIDANKRILFQHDAKLIRVSSQDAPTSAPRMVEYIIRGHRVSREDFAAVCAAENMYSLEVTSIRLEAIEDRISDVKECLTRYDMNGTEIGNITTVIAERDTT